MKKFNSLIQGEIPVLVDFYADWCGPCKTLAPILKALKDKSGNTLTIIKINVDKNPAISSSLQISGVPTLILYKNGKSVWRQSGVVPLHQLEGIVKKFM